MKSASAGADFVGDHEPTPEISSELSNPPCVIRCFFSTENPALLRHRLIRCVGCTHYIKKTCFWVLAKNLVFLFVSKAMSYEQTIIIFLIEVVLAHLRWGIYMRDHKIIWKFSASCVPHISQFSCRLLVPVGISLPSMSLLCVLMRQTQLSWNPSDSNTWNTPTVICSP